MPVANFKTYCKMLDNAKKNKFAFPAINISSMVTANAALKAFADNKSDGIIQISTGAGEFASGQGIKNAVIGAVSIADHVRMTSTNSSEVNTRNGFHAIMLAA